MQQNKNSNSIMETETIQKNRGKIFTFLTVFVLSNMSVFAQDIILKQDGSELKAKVLEVTDQQIKYKDFDFQSGPTRNINISDVFMITYENGQKEVFNKRTSTPSPANNYEEKEVLHKQISTPPPPTNNNTSSRELNNDLKNEFYRIGTDDKAMLFFFERNNFTEYASRFQSACKNSNSGKASISVGVILTAIGIGLITAGMFDKDPQPYFTVGGTFVGTGSLLTIVGIPVSAGAGGRKRAIKNEFAREHFGVGGYTYQPELNFGITQSGGIGLTFKF